MLLSPFTLTGLAATCKCQHLLAYSLQANNFMGTKDLLDLYVNADMGSDIQIFCFEFNYVDDLFVYHVMLHVPEYVASHTDNV